MKFVVQRREHPNIRRYGPDYTLAKQFSDAVQKELGEFLKAVVLFGSTAKESGIAGERDIDILMVVNDLTLVASPEVISAYRVIVDNAAARVSKRFHINTMRITQLWEYARNGDPILFNMLREGVPLYDTGFVEPLQTLLSQGRIRPTKEAVFSYYARSPLTLENSKRHLLQATADLYWAVVDSAHAALMYEGHLPGMPSMLAQMIDEHLVNKGLVTASAPKIMDFFYHLVKEIDHRERPYVSGEDYDRWKKDAEHFIEMMRAVIQRRPGQKATR